METKTLVVYFSATGTTKRLAEYAAEILNADLYEIVPENPYTEADLAYYTNDRADQEQNDVNARPKISGSVENMEGVYETFSVTRLIVLSLHVGFYISGCHSLCIHGKYFFLHVLCYGILVFFYELRLILPVPVAWDCNIHVSIAGVHGLFRMSVAAVVSILVPVIIL